jgi:hypothetical protein
VRVAYHYHKHRMLVLYWDDYCVSFLLKQVSSGVCFDMYCNVTWNRDHHHHLSVELVRHSYSIYKTSYSIAKLLTCMCKHNFS